MELWSIVDITLVSMSGTLNHCQRCPLTAQVFQSENTQRGAVYNAYLRQQ